MKRPAFSTPRALRAPRSSRWVPGNHFELLENGEEFFPRVFQAIADARREVMLETFILFEDKIGQQLHAALLAAAQRGVEVHVLVDGFGSANAPAGFFQPCQLAVDLLVGGGPEETDGLIEAPGQFRAGTGSFGQGGQQRVRQRHGRET